MPYCPRCGVETNLSVRRCPLCETPIPALTALGPGEPAWPPQGGTTDPAKVYATGPERRGRALLFVTAILGTAALVVATIDAVLNGSVTWARWPLASLAAAWGLTVALLKWHRQPRGWSTAWFVVVNLLLAGFDLAAGAPGWYFPLGLPLTVVAFGLAAFGTLTIQRSRHGYNVFGLVPALLAAGLTAIDLLISGWTGSWHLSWSLITDLVFVPLAVLFYFLHFTLPRVPDLRRIFHF